VILEHAVLDVSPDKASAFEAALDKALPLIAASEGFVGLEVRPCLERRGRYLLIVRWRSIADHDPGFRKSDRYAEWRSLLHHFYDPFPVVEHYGEPVATR
jgi:heme-degrading monooxygenase HmoA